MVEFTPGLVIGDFTLQTLIGRGASGEVWRALRNSDSLPVAIKFMGENLITSANAAKHRVRMEREVSALRLLNHPSIPTLIASDLEHLPPYLVMPFIEGEAFDKLFSRGEMLRIPLERRLSMLTALADALGAAHDLGVIHRDVKPANMIAGDPPYLIDFGLALGPDAARMTMMGVGTTFYMPPESNIPDALSDIFSFGVVAYEVLFNMHPIFSPEDSFSANQALILMTADRRIRSGEWRVPSRVPYQDLPPDLRYSDFPRLDEIFIKVISARETRYTDVRQFAADLNAAIKPPPKGIKLGATTAELQRLELQDTQLEPAATPPAQDDRFTILEVKKAEAEAKSNAEGTPTDTAQDKKKRWRLFGGKT
ncbi:MAG: serine/threonine-protein kinase [Anaerolineae bacterium]